MKYLKWFKLSFLILILVYYKTESVHAQDVVPLQNGNLDDFITKAKCSKWSIVKKDKNKGVNISTRWLYFGDTIKTREMALYFRVNAGIKDVISNLRSTSALKTWNLGIRELNLIDKSDSTWITHTVYDIPYPFSQQDLVTKSTIIEHVSNTIINVNAVPYIIKQTDNIQRQQSYHGRWILQTNSNGMTEVHFSAISFTETNIPRFIRDPIVQNKLLKSFIKLKELSTTKP
ncbi:hypothetical protein K5X82_18530 [Halosquirtibacter xylanolyticus]|uniref:hypothetical protein n=1 Tax=Halosquirtibacter xylanolyticus TaxID=3374599 RepID=UPI0037487D34|nr:hypothetical protein K5X82_18530 [Prolixibacteraceae bacterium]